MKALGKAQEVHLTQQIINPKHPSVKHFYEVLMGFAPIDLALLCIFIVSSMENGDKG